MDQTVISFKEKISKNYSPDDEEKYLKWIGSVNATLGVLGKKPWHQIIHRVPVKLRAVKEEAYTPQMVSIGPFHRHKPELRAMEELKWRYMLDFLHRSSRLFVLKNNPYGRAFRKFEEIISNLETELGLQELNDALENCNKLIFELQEEITGVHSFSGSWSLPFRKALSECCQIIQQLEGRDSVKQALEKFFKILSELADQVHRMKMVGESNTIASNSTVDEFGLIQFELILDECGRTISNLEEESRGSYAENINLDKHQLVEMLLVDGCFMLELFFKHYEQLNSHFLVNNTQMVQTLQHDLMLLENQIPFEVLQLLFKQTPDINASLEDLISSFFSVPFHKDTLTDGITLLDYNAYVSLLDMFHSVCCPKHHSLNGQIKYWGFRRCATRLFNSGIQFKVAKSKNMVDIVFHGGILFIPKIEITKLNDTLLRNFIALEQSSIGKHTITSYVKLMSTLIRSQKDVYLLEREGIIVNSVGMEDVSAYFKSLCREIIFVDFCFERLCNEAENYKSYPWQWDRVKGRFRIMSDEWKGSIEDLKRDYFQTRWSFIAFLAASFVIILALVQTFYTISSYYTNPNQ